MEIALARQKGLSGAKPRPTVAQMGLNGLTEPCCLWGNFRFPMSIVV